MKKIAIIILNYNGKNDTLELLNSLKKLRTCLPTGKTTNYELRTIVVDNASSDGSVSAIKQQFSDIDIVQTGLNKGFAGGFNKGIDYANIWGADYFLLLNNDILIKDEDLLVELVKTAELDSNIGLVSPKIYFAPGFEFYKERYKKEDKGKVIWFAGGKFDWNNIGSIHRGIDEVDEGRYNDIEEEEIISGACVLVKREVFERVGGFNEKFFLYFEDSDFIKRGRDAGFKTFYNGKVSVLHKVSRSTGLGSTLTDYFHTRNRLYFGFKYASSRTKFALFREAVKFVVFGRKAQRLGVWDFFAGNFGPLPYLIEQKDIQYPLKLSIVVVNYNTADLVKNLLKSIFDQINSKIEYVHRPGFDEKTMEVVVLDNGSEDNCKEVIKEYLPKIKFLQNEKNQGFSKGYNKAIRFSQGENILMLNSDIELMEGTMERLLKDIEEFEQDAVISGKLVFPDGHIQDSVFHLPTITGALKEYFLRQKGAYFMYLPQAMQVLKVDGAAMATYFIPRKVLDKVGLLDENLFIFFEDVEYARRLKKFGIPLYFDPELKFLHHHGASTKKQGISKSYEQLKKSSMYYHGKIYYWLLYYTLLFCQKFSGTTTPGEVR